jgi:hypothetical protein
MPDASATSGTKKSQLPFLVPTIIAAVYFLGHMVTATRYGYFRDALYYLACSEHLAWGYVDQPPLIVFIAWLARHTLGVSLPALLFWPALAGAARIILTAAFARELGAKKFGIALAAALAATPAVWYVIMTPATLPFWLGGLWFYFSDAGKKLRVFGWTFIFTIGFFLLAHGKNYYPAPAYPLVLAAGAVASENFLGKRHFEERWREGAAVKVAIFGWLAVGILLLLPVVLPVLPISAYLRYQAHLPFAVPKSEHNQDTAILPQHYADEFGWEDMVRRVASSYHSLSPEEQSRTAIFASNYGEAGAVDFFGSRYGLPKAISTHQNYFLWGPRNYDGEIVIRIGTKLEDARESYESVVVAATLDNPYTMPHEKNPILLCRHRKKNLHADWPDIKNWD